MPGWQIHGSKVAYDDGYTRLVVHDVTRSWGRRGPYAHLDTNKESVFIVAVNKNQPPEVVMLDHSRFPTRQGSSLEIPAGGCREGEPVEDAGKRELKEETGFVAEKWTIIASHLQAANAITNERTNICIAEGLTRTREDEQAEEGISGLGMYTFAQIHTMILAGEITDYMSIGAVLLAEVYLDKPDLRGM